MLSNLALLPLPAPEPISAQPGCLTCPPTSRSLGECQRKKSCSGQSTGATACAAEPQGKAQGCPAARYPEICVFHMGLSGCKACGVPKSHTRRAPTPNPSPTSSTAPGFAALNAAISEARASVVTRSAASDPGVQDGHTNVMQDIDNRGCSGGQLHVSKLKHKVRAGSS
jgi:hypothetical protein